MEFRRYPFRFVEIMDRVDWDPKLSFNPVGTMNRSIDEKKARKLLIKEIKALKPIYVSAIKDWLRNDNMSVAAKNNGVTRSALWSQLQKVVMNVRKEMKL